MQPQSDANKSGTGGRWPPVTATCTSPIDVPSLAVDTEAVKATISKALIQRSILPRYDELRTLHGDLLRHIQALMPMAERHIDGLWHGSVEWYSKRSQLSYVPYEMGTGLGTGLQSAAWHVRSLGYTLRFLFENSGLPGAGEDVKP